VSGWHTQRVPKFTIRINVWLTSEMADELDDWRRVHQNPPTRPEALRQLAEAGLQVFSPETIRALEAWAATQNDAPAWPEAARRLLAKALRDEAEKG
jgi:hypothetical protein